MTQDATPSRIPTLAVTLGDVAGIGPEITAKMLLGHDELRQRARLLVVGDAAVLAQAVQAVGGDPARVRVIATPAEATNQPGSIEVIQAGPSLAHVPPGQLSAEAGDGSVRYVTTACALARDGLIDGIVTAPLNKAAMHMAGHKWPGHTELLAQEFGVKTFSLVLSAGDLYIFHATTHVSLRQAIEDVNPQRMRAVLRLAGSFARALGRADHPVAVAGLNPHAGENGIFGTEDAEILAPAVTQANNAEGILAAGPIPADALFPQAVRGKWKFVIACYHDQGYAPFKSVYGDDGVNITVACRWCACRSTTAPRSTSPARASREDSLVLAAERAAQLAPGWHQVWETARSTTGG